MREELYRKLKARLEMLCIDVDGVYFDASAENMIGADAIEKDRVIKHIDLWNRNVEFIEQETAWERPAVFIEFVPFKWKAIVPGVEYRAQPLVNLHIVTDWVNQDADIQQFRLMDKIHELLAGMTGKTFMEFDIDSSSTNHNHEELVENIETYTCVAFRQLQQRY